MTHTRTTHVETLHLRGVGLADAPGLRRAASAWLGATDLHPPGLSPSAVLVVQHLPDPLPQRCARPEAGRPNAAWIQAVRNALDAAARRAARPVDGRLPPSAEAVCFADRAEWMACLALALARGTASERWWWRAFLHRVPGLGRSARVAEALTDPSRAAPAALAHLATWRGTGEVLRVLSTPDVDRVLARMAKAFGVNLPTIHREGRSSTHSSNLDYSGSPPDTQPELAPARPWDAATQAAIPPDVPSRVHVALVGVGLTLHRRPSIVRNASFAAALARWGGGPAAPFAGRSADRTADGTGRSVDARSPAHGEQGESGKPGEKRTSDVPSSESVDALPSSFRDEDTAPDSPSSRSPVVASPDGHGGNSESDASPPSESGFDDTAESSDLPDRGASGEHDESAPLRSVPSDDEAPAPDSPSVPQEPGEGAASPRDASTSRVETSTGDSTSAAPRRASKDASSSSSSGSPKTAPARETPRTRDAFSFRTEPEVLGTELGGVLYLVNLMVRLELPEIFEDTHRLGSTAGPWGVLEAIARALLGPDAERFADDGVWTALARLDDRDSGTPPGEAFPQPDAFACPPSWIDESGGLEGPLRWHASEGRLRMWTDHCLLADRPLTDDELTVQVEHVAHRYGVATSDVQASASLDPWHDAPDLEAAAPSLAWWAARAVPFLRYRLTQALDRSPEADLTDALFAVPGTLHLSSMHVDWAAPLDAVSLPVRLAGLDRDPGWTPSFGRVILFHFD